MSKPDFWAKPDAKQTSKKFSDLKKELDAFFLMKTKVQDLVELSDLSGKDEESLRQINEQYVELEKEFRTREFIVLFSGAHDASDCIIAIHSGAGGTEAQDWAEMLLRMLLRFAEKKGFDVQLVDETRGGEAGIKNATIMVRGRYAYGWLKSESGVHRLVRISPFDAEKMRHTSFALIEVLPLFEELDIADAIKIDSKDLRIDTFLSRGHGGQSVQTTYSAVRIVHIPTGITVQCQNERSQLQNKETAMKILRSRLYQKYLEQQQKEKKDLRGEYHEAAWGNQARSYVLHPYKLVKDHRTDYETPNAEDVLEGELDSFVEAYLRKLKSKNEKEKIN